MKILLLSSRVFPHVGGVEKVIAELSKRFQKENDVVIVSSLDVKGSNLFKIDDTISISNGLRIKRIWMNIPRSVLGWVSFPYRFLFGSLKFISFLKSEKPDVINFHFPDDVSPYLWLSRFFYKVPLVINIHGNDLHKFSKNPFYRFFIFSLLNNANKIIVNSKYMMNDLLDVSKISSSKVSIIHNGIDLNYINSIKAKKNIEGEYIFFIGRLVHKKGVDILLKAFSQIEDKKIKLVLEGNGEELASLKELILDLNISKRIVLTEGKLSEEEKFMYMKNALFGVIPSRIEPFGIVALEYLSCKTPIIASKTGGLIDLLDDHKNCLFFKNEDIDDLKLKINEMIKNAKLRESLSERGMDLVKKYTWDMVSDEYLKLYKSL